MTACMVNGGSNGAFTNHLPWYHDQATADIYRFFTTLHYQLRPYIFSALVDAHLHGGSLLEDVSFEQESHKLGHSIFFKAISSDSDRVSFFLPKDGFWIDFWTDERYEGGTEITKKYDVSEAPLFIKSGSIIPLEICNSYTGIGDKSFKGKITVLVYPDDKNEILFHNPTGDGVGFEDIEISYNKGKIEVESDKEYEFIFLIKNCSKNTIVSGSNSFQYDDAKNWIEIKKKGRKFKLLIE